MRLQSMTWLVATALLSTGCAASPAPQAQPGPSVSTDAPSPVLEPQQDATYNQGVDAYKRKDYAEAARQWRQAIGQGQVLALNNLGFLTFYGLGVEADQRQGVELWRQGATQAVSEAQWHLGEAYLEGKGVEQDQVQAYAWIRCAIETATRNVSRRDTDVEQHIAQDARESLVVIVDALPAEKQQQAHELAAKYINEFAGK